MSTQDYIDKIKQRKGLQRQPISESQPNANGNPIIVQDARNHTHVWKKEERQTHPTLTSYVCIVQRCGLGRLIDEKTDSIDNY